MSPIRPPAPEPPEPPPPAPELFFTLPAMASRGSGARSAASERNERGEKEGPLRQPPPALAAEGLRGRCPPGGAPLRERGRRGAARGRAPETDPQAADAAATPNSRARELTSTRVPGRSRKALTKFPRPQLPPRPSGTGRGHPGRGPEETRACALCWRSEVWKERGGVQGRTCALGRSRACRPCSLWTGLGASRSESLLCSE